MRRYIVYALYDPSGIVHDYVRCVAKELAQFASKLVIVCNFKMGVDDLSEYADEVILRENKGFDAAAYKDVIQNNKEEIIQYDELLLTNDTYYAPIYPFNEMFSEMDKESCDFWGVTRHPGGFADDSSIPSHIQSYFICFRNEIVKDIRFYDFWESMKILDSVNDVIHTFEIGINVFLTSIGYKGIAYMERKHFELPLKEDNPYLMYPYELISLYSIPLLKRRSLDIDSDWFDNGMKALNYIRDFTEYDERLITDHIKRLSSLNNSRKEYDYNALDLFVANHQVIYIYGDGKWAHNLDCYFKYYNKTVPRHVVSKRKDNNEALELSDISITKGVGIIIAIADPNAISEVYSKCKKRVEKNDIFCPKHFQRKLKETEVS